MSPQAIAAVGKLLAAAAVVAIVSTQGLQLELRQLRWILRRPGLLLRSVLAVLVLVPAAALAISWGLGVERRAVIGIVLMGVSPAAPLVLRRAREARGDASFAAGVDVLLAVLAVASVPLTLALLSRMFPGAHASISPWAVAGQVGRAQLIPLAVGIAVRRLLPAWAERLARPLARGAFLLLLMFLVAALAVEGRELLRIGPGAYAAMALAVATSIGIGHALGGPARETRTVLAVVAALRNPGLALLIVQLNFAGLDVVQVILAYACVTVLLLGAYASWRKRGRAPAA